MSSLSSIESVLSSVASTGYSCLAPGHGIEDESALVQFARKLGPVIKQFGSVSVLDVSPREGAHPNGPFGRGKLPLHMDAVFMKEPFFPKYVIFRAPRFSDEGSRHLLVDTKAVDAQMDPQLLSRLRSISVSFAHPGFASPHKDDTSVLKIAPPQADVDHLYIGPVSDSDGWLRLLAPMRSIDEGFETYFEHADRQAFELEGVEPGSVWVLDNRRMLHGRLSFKGERHIQRVHVRATD